MYPGETGGGGVGRRVRELMLGGGWDHLEEQGVGVTWGCTRGDLYTYNVGAETEMQVAVRRDPQSSVHVSRRNLGDHPSGRAEAGSHCSEGSWKVKPRNGGT